MDGSFLGMSSLYFFSLSFSGPGAVDDDEAESKVELGVEKGVRPRNWPAAVTSVEEQHALQDSMLQDLLARGCHVFYGCTT